MTIISCTDCRWEVDVDDPQTALTNHRNLRHPDDVDPTREVETVIPEARRLPQLAHVVWHEQAVAAVQKARDSGREFTLYEALRDAGVGDPPNHKSAMGTFAKEVERLLDLQLVRFDRSKRPDSSSSAVAVWRGKNTRAGAQRKDTA